VVRGNFFFFFHITHFIVPLWTGQDATEAFEDVGHSDEARELLPAMFVGEFEKSPVSHDKLYPSLALLSTCYSFV